ncbi:MAG: tetratricopeptide repeat protein [Acidobacteria bacterium]|nr:tetratricopeptide repeat protein [Acidobacteriota bacterium]
MADFKKITLVSLIAGLAVEVASLVGCRDSDSRRTNGKPASGTLTFTRDVAPVFFRECVACHRPGESAPFSLLTYRDVKRRARTIVAVTRSRFMPPWLPDPGYGQFAGERRLTDAQIETIRRWEAQGAPEGDPADLPPLPQFTEGWRLGQPDLVIKLPRPYILRADPPEVWRNFVIPIPVSTTRYVKTVELRPGSAGVVHHALLGVDPTRSSRRRDERDVEPGFDGMGMGDSQAPDGHLLGWTPGMVPFPGVEGKAWRLEPGTDLVLQLHVIPSGKPEVLNPIVGLYFAKAPPVGPLMSLMRLDADQAIDIPPGEKHFIVTDRFELPVDVEVLAAYPHAHFLAKTMEGLARLPDGTERWLIRISDWDFKWQDIYRYAKPIHLPKGTTISMRYSYDNSADNVRNPSRPPKRVVAGLRSSDEMAHLQLQVLPRSAEDAVLLKEALYRQALRKNPSDVWAYYELGNALRDKGQPLEAIRQYRAALERDPSHAAARNNLGVVLATQGNVDEAMSQYRQALRFEPDFADAHYNLGNALRAKGRLDEAIRHYREVLRLEPDLAEAHNNLGEVLSLQGKLDEAIAQFRIAVRIKPDSAEAHNNLGAGLGLQGKLGEAITHFRQALQIEPDHANARENLRIAVEKAVSAARVQR